MIDYIFSALVMLLPFLYQYASPIIFISLGEFLLFPFIVMFLIDILAYPSKSIFIDRALLVFLLLTFLLTFIVGVNGLYFSAYDSLTLFARVLFYSALIFVSRSHFRLMLAMKVYTVFTVVFSVYLLLQYAAHMAAGINLPLTLPFPLFYAEQRDYIVQGNLEWYYNNYMFRPSSLFIEPSYFTSYALGNLCYQLFYVDEKHVQPTARNYIITALISMALIASTSSAGILGLVLIFAYFIMKKITTKRNSTVYINGKYVLLSVLIIIGLLFLYTSKFASEGVGRTLKGASIAARIYRGFYVYGEFDLFHQIFGVGLNNLADYMNFYGLHTPYDETNLNIVASLIGTLVCNGWLGFLSLCYYLFSLYRRQVTLFGKSIVLLIAYFMSYDVIIFSFRWGFYCVLAYSTCRLGYKPHQKAETTIKKSRYIRESVGFSKIG